MLRQSDAFGQKRCTATYKLLWLEYRMIPLAALGRISGRGCGRYVKLNCRSMIYHQNIYFSFFSCANSPLCSDRVLKNHPEQSTHCPYLSSPYPFPYHFQPPTHRSTYPVTPRTLVPPRHCLTVLFSRDCTLLCPRYCFQNTVNHSLIPSTRAEYGFGRRISRSLYLRRHRRLSHSNTAPNQPRSLEPEPQLCSRSQEPSACQDMCLLWCLAGEVSWYAFPLFLASQGGVS